MQDFLVTASNSTIKFGATGNEEVIQNVWTIISTTKFSVPMDREFGIDSSMLDKPTPVSKSQFTVNVVDAIRKYEPRAVVTGVEFDGDALTGKLIPKVRFYINGN